MTIGIDISQLAYRGTGVANYLENWLSNLLKTDKKNNYILFYSSLRNTYDLSFLNANSPNVKIKIYRFPPSLLNILWNKLHVFPVERLVGPVDLFITSDWTEPPALSKKATIIYDLVVYKSPNETAKKIVDTQKRKLHWVKKESSWIFTISESSKKDIEEILKIDKNKINVIYPGI